MSLLRLLTAIPKGLELAQVSARAAKGDPEAIEYLRQNGAYDVLDMALSPGAGNAGRKIAEGVQEMFGGPTEHHDPARPPWMPFIGRLMKQPSGGHILLGHMGTGKTTLAIKLAWQWMQRNGYRVEWCGMYRGDVPDFGVKVHIETLIDRMGALSEYLKAEGVKDEEFYTFGEADEDVADEGEKRVRVIHEGRPGGRKKKRYRPVMPPQRRIIIIDEMGMAMSSNANDPARTAALQYLAQSRHLDSLVLFLAQNAGQIPLRLIGSCCNWVKKPQGDEKDTDRDNPLVRQIWEEAETAFKGYSRNPWHAEYTDPRSWVYVHCQSLLGAAGYKGLVPFKPYRSEKDG